MKKAKKKIANCKIKENVDAISSLKTNLIRNNKFGITLIALVVTIVVLLILAGITINMLFSDGGIFDTANQAKIEHEIGALKDRINNVIADWSIERLTKPGITVDDLWDKMVDADIIDNPDEDVSGPKKVDENDVYEITTNDGYIVEIIVTPDGEVSIGDVTKGDSTGGIGGATDGLKEGNIIASSPTWNNGEATITLSKGEEVAENLTIEWQKGDVIAGNWTQGTEVTGLHHNDTVYARLTDGQNHGAAGSVDILDGENPQKATIELSATTTKTEETITATVTHTDNESGVAIENCKWIYNTNSDLIGTEEDSYNNSFTQNAESINLTTNIEGTYYLHVLTTDVAGNKTESISGAITVEKKIMSDGSFSKEKGVNIPDLADGALTPVKWENNNMVITTEDDPDWYNYGTTTDTRKWANAITSDGSIWVWIPRYAYQITTGYHANSATGGTINIKFMQGTSNIAADGTSTWNNASGQGNWNIHPAFEYSKTVPGIWVAKFEASQSDAGANDEDYGGQTGGTSGIIKIQPGVNCWRVITVGDAYTKSLDYAKNTLQNESLGSHLMKNTEWGAVAYLTQSVYGKNSEVWINPNKNYLTGHAGTGPRATSTTSTFAYNTTNGVNASTTGNVYGIYDMKGCAYEYVAGYINNGNPSLNTYASSVIKGANYTKDVYTSNGDTRDGNYAAAATKYGDAIYETSVNGNGPTSAWYGSYSQFPYSNNIFFIRGNYYDDYKFSTSTCSIFSSDSPPNGSSYTTISFRPALAIT